MTIHSYLDYNLNIRQDIINAREVAMVHFDKSARYNLIGYNPCHILLKYQIKSAFHPRRILGLCNICLRRY